jgi:hypothetical protein
MQISDEMRIAARQAFKRCRPVDRVACQDFGMQQDDIIDQQLEAAITAALAGYVVVPREPTEEMLDAGGWAIAERNGDMSPETEALAQVAYAAMIDASQHRGDDAAPPPAGQEG